jgi:prevent-host-death family protein
MESDNLISVKEISATDAARNFSDLLDSVEHDGASYTVVRRGKAIAVIRPTDAGSGRALKDALRNAKPDPDFAKDIAEVRALLLPQEDRWQR